MILRNNLVFHVISAHTVDCSIQFKVIRRRGGSDNADMRYPYLIIFATHGDETGSSPRPTQTRLAPDLTRVFFRLLTGLFISPDQIKARISDKQTRTTHVPLPPQTECH